METGRKTRLRRILRRKRIKRAIKAYGNYIAAGVLVFVVCVAVVGAAVKPTASTLPKNTPEPVQTTQPTGSTTEEAEAYPFNLMSFDWDGEALDGWTRYEVPEDYADNGGYLPECMQQYTYIICKQYGVEYTLVLAIIEIESGYRWDASCKEGSTGYNQTDRKEYTVQKGDSLWKIAQRFYGNGAACYALAHKNGIKNPDLIYPGQVLKI